MCSRQDYEKLLQKYQTEGIAHNMTLQMFCSMNKVPYNSFEKYLKTCSGMSDIHRVNLTDIPDEVQEVPVENKTPEKPEEATTPRMDTQTHILVNIRMTNDHRELM